MFAIKDIIILQDLCISNAIQRFTFALDHGLPPTVLMGTIAAPAILSLRTFMTFT